MGVRRQVVVVVVVVGVGVGVGVGVVVVVVVVGGGSGYVCDGTFLRHCKPRNVANTSTRGF